MENEENNFYEQNIGDVDPKKEIESIEKELSNLKAIKEPDEEVRGRIEFLEEKLYNLKSGIGDSY